MRCGLEVEVYLVAPLCRGMLCACTIPSRADDGPWSSYGRTIPTFLYGTRTRSVVGGVASPPSCHPVRGSSLRTGDAFTGRGGER